MQRSLIITTAVAVSMLTAEIGRCADDPADSLTEERFRELHSELQPGDEPWRTIPWKIALLDAQRTAVAEKKPLFIWAMDGHPLGCT